MVTQVRTTNKQERTEAINNTRRVIVAMPAVKAGIRKFGYEIAEELHISKESHKYFPPLIMAINGKIISKHLKNLKYEEGGLTIAPIAEYWFRDGFYRLEMSLQYRF